MNGYEEKIAEQLKQLSDEAMLEDKDIDGAIDKITIHYKKKIEFLEKELKSKEKLYSNQLEQLKTTGGQTKENNIVSQNKTRSSQLSNTKPQDGETHDDTSR